MSEGRVQGRAQGIARYPHLMLASGGPDTAPDKMKYSINVLIHKTDPECAKIEAQVNALIATKYPNGVPAKFKSCWKDLALSDNDKDNVAVHDYMSLTVGSYENIGRPGVLDHNRRNVLDPEIDGSAIGKTVYVCYGLGLYDKASNIGITAYLNGTLVTNTMGNIPIASLSSKPSVESMFADVTVPAATAVPVAPSPVASPVAPPPAPPAPPVAPPPAAPTGKVMTAKANGATYESYTSMGWSDEQLLEQGYLQPPNGVTPSFMS